jgi:hypothetical protein
VEDYKEELADYFGRTVVHPAGLTLCILLAIATFVVPRKWAFVPMVVLACFVSSAQRIIIFSLNFDFLRLLILAGWLRLALRGELKGLTWNVIDTCVVAYAFCGVAAYCALHADGDALKNRLGWAYDVLGFYFLFRFLFADGVDPRDVGKAFAVIAVPVAAFFAFEFATHRNLFAALGGVPEFTWIRDGRLRCQGPFAHPIIAGVFWAAQLPLFGAMWLARGRTRTLGLIGLVAALVIIVFTNSSTSITAVIFGAVAMLAFPLRRSMRAVRWSIAAALFMLHMVMKKPVWHLLARATVFDASTGWHRFNVIDQSVHHFQDWWLVGETPEQVLKDWDIDDVTNEYVFTGIEGGLFTVLALLAMIGFAFQRAGRACARAASSRPATYALWALGAALFVHCMNFMGLAYFGQARVIWFLLLAMIASQAVPAMAWTRGAVPSVVTAGARRAVRARPVA